MALLGVLVTLAALTAVAHSQDYSNNTSVKILQQYVQINTTTGGDLTPAVNFWLKLATDEGLYTNVYWFTDGYPIVVIKWPGLNSSLGSIMLNSHMDVVPADEDDGWTYPPFSAHLDDDGVMWGRGTQDMKSVGVQYFEALRSLKAKNVSLLRDVYMTLMPDEETGAANGMVPFVASEEFKAMNVALELDEGTSFQLPVSPVFYQDKAVWQIQVDCYGTAAHGSTSPPTNQTATGKCRNVINTLLNFRDQEYEKSQAADITNAGSYTSLNLNKMNGGTANNVIPRRISLVFDIRLSTTTNETQFDAQLRQWIAEAGENITMTYLQKDVQSPATIVGSSNPFWTAFSKAITTKGFIVLPLIPPGSTDARHLRSAGYPAFGFSPMPNTDLLLHSVDERLSMKTFLAGIEVYKQIIQNLANIAGNEASSDPSVYLYYTSTQ